MSITHQFTTHKSPRDQRLRRREMDTETFVRWLAMERYHSKEQDEWATGYEQISQLMAEWHKSKAEGCPQLPDHRGITAKASQLMAAHREMGWQARCHKTWESLQKWWRSSFKLRMPAWSPAAYPEGVKSRSNAGVRGLCAAVLDMDEGDFSFAGERHFWDAKGWTYVMHTSPSHTEEQHKLRLIFPLKEEIPKEKHPLLWDYFYNLSGKKADPKAKDASRIFFMNFTPFAMMKGWTHVHWGELCDWRALPLAPPKPKFRKMRPANTSARDEALNRDPVKREQLGLSMGGQSNGKTISKVLCPECNRRSLWWFIDVQGMLRARCNHQNSCGANLWLDQLGGTP